ncbi:amino acid ABC transporter ATP-binding protein [Labrys wisconsinensis]|uniref:Polar amino acid transport system ATP-binding protein n=1 Tax=Labrys wisconsinensis TaxID=425677 RepID=A0ABU0JLH7_9HYPH|nr:amino acid ABC transporter ATP-binding protein [Labrys wisconsinensis]MDQ0474223.1 polar amino acid transport system ATP-binding protein [Labrys wisconsinensis]
MSSIERTDALLGIERLSKSFAGQPVLREVSLAVPEGRVTAIIGSSGSGKSTLLRCVNTLEDYEAGTIRLRGERLGYAGEGRTRRRLGDRRLSAQRGRIGMVFQGYNLFPHLTARQNIMLGLRRVGGQGRAEAAEAAAGWLARVGLAERAEHYPYQLSGGQQQRVAIARAFALRPELVLLDEVTSALDPELVGEVLAVIRALAGAGMTMMVVSHELAFVRDVADEVAFMHQGRIVEIGPPAELLQRPATPELAAFIARFRTRPGPAAIALPQEAPA